MPAVDFVAMFDPAHPKPSRTALNSWLRALQHKQALDTGPHKTLLSVVAEVTDKFGENLALCDEATRLRYRDLMRLSEHFARWTLAHCPEWGETVCVMMPNSADYVAVWLGISHTGRVAALINTNLVGDALAHSIRVSGARHIIVDQSLQNAVATITDRLSPDLKVWVHNSDDDGLVVNGPRARLASASALAMSDRPNRHDRALLIYTSGTTGAPKAAYVSHARILEWSAWFAGMMDAQPLDRLYNCLPMYHSVGGVVAIGSMLVKGGSVVVRPRFSASRFWDDVVDNGCTIFQYIGELCRYLVRNPRHRLETSHNLRLACGNGLRGDVWETFQSRFKIPRVLEFYAATEGNVSLYNCEGKPGAIGRIPPFLAHSYPIEIIRSDATTGEPVRDRDGFCIRCAIDEVGEAIGLIAQDSHSAARQFHGYTDASATIGKMLRNVFEPGDCWFRTGDLMRKDALGYFYFVDRLGDTFRWKGENVSTMEVASIIASGPGVADAVVYGVAIPGTEGRAGMAAIVTDETFSLDILREHMVTNLPEYAHPLFVRLCQAIRMTGTFKLSKGELAQEGIVPMGNDLVWFNDRAQGAFIALDPTLRRKIVSGAIKL